jgi:RNA polymerase sigma-70 factor, ECF subfamily
MCRCPLSRSCLRLFQLIIPPISIVRQVYPTAKGGYSGQFTLQTGEGLKDSLSQSVDVPLSSDHDAVVAGDVVRGDNDAMEVLFSSCVGPVLRIARRLLGDQGEAEDTCQQVYFEVYRDIRTFDAHRGPFKSWVLRRALHRSINRRKHLEAEGFYRSTALTEDQMGDTAILSNKTPFNLLPPELSHLTTELLAMLEPDERQVIILTFYQCLTRQETAKALGITVSAVRHRLQKAFKIMFAALVTANSGNETRKDTRVG